MPDPVAAPQTIRLVDPDGQIRDVALDSAPSVLQDPRWQVATHAAELDRLQGQAREADYGGVGGAAKAVGAGFLRGVTLGGSDVVARAVGGDQAAIDLSGLREVNPGLSTGSEIVGGAAPALFSGGASTPAGAAMRVGAGIAERGAAAGAAGKLGAAVAGAAAEGALYGTGQGVSELALSTDPLTLEHAASVLSSNALYGAGLGAGIGAAAHGAAVGLSKAKGAIDGALERRAAKALTPEQAIDSGDLELLTKPNLKAAREAEVERIQAARAPERERFVSDLADLREQGKKEQLWLATEGATERDVRTAGRNFTKADLKLDALLANKVGLAERPERALAALREQRQALEEIEAYGRVKSLEFDPPNVDADVIRGAILKGEIPGERGPFTPRGLDYAAQREIERRYAKYAAGPTPEQFKTIVRLGKIPAAIERNEQLQKAISDLTAAPTSERLAKIEEAEALLGAPKETPLGQQLLEATPVVGPIAKAAQKALGGLRGAAGKAGERLGKATSSFLGAASRGADKAAKHAPVLATAVLKAASYAPPGATAPPALADLPSLYKARTDEIKSQVHIAPDGSFQMRPDARAKMAARFDPIRAMDPRGADQLETAGARRIEWLASQIPRRPDIAAVPGMGGDLWRPSDMEMRAFARKVAAVEDPHGVIERAVHGAITPEDAAAIRAVYPALLEDAVGKIMAGLPALKKPLPYKRRLSLSMLTGQPLDPALHPGVLAVLQGSYANDEGVPQTSPAMPMPAFGSVKRSAPQPTPAQERSQGDLDA